MDVIGGFVAVLAVAAAAWLLLVAILWLHRPSRELVGPALRLLPDLVRLVRSILADPATPRAVRLALGGLLVYLLLPLDVVPDFVPGVGALDDVILAAVVLRWAARRMGPAGLGAHWAGSEAGLALLRRLVGIEVR